MAMEDLQHAVLLYHQGRYTDAERALGEHLRQEPDDAGALHLLAEVCLAQGRTDKAREVAQQALGHRPGDGDTHELLARIALRDEDLKAAEKHAREAIALDPDDSGHHGTLGHALLLRNRSEEALAAADRGLALDPEDLRCLNLRTEALARLGRREEADATIAKALALDPDNSSTHANTGWAMLRRGDAARALENFREALRRDPTNAYAKSGLVEALKARYLVYRLFLRYTLWVGGLGGRTQWFLILGLWFGSRILRGMAKSNPALEPIIIPILAIYFVFVISTWVIEPLSNLLLRFNPYGRYALDREELMTSNFTGASLAVAVAGAVAWAVTGLGPFLMLAAVGFLMMIPTSSMLRGGKRGRNVLVGAAGLLAVMGLVSVVIMFMSGGVELFLVFLVGAFGYQWLANYYTIRT